MATLLLNRQCRIIDAESTAVTVVRAAASRSSATTRPYELRRTAAPAPASEGRRPKG